MKKVSTGILYGIIALVAIAALAVIARNQSRTGRGEQAVQKKMPLVVVSPVQLGTISQMLETTGTVESENTVNIVPKVEQRIVWMPFNEGNTVRRGQVIVRLDGSEASDQLSAALAEVSVAEARLRDVLSGSRPQEIRAAEAALAQSQAAVESAKATLQDADIELSRQQRMLKIGGASQEDVDKAQTRSELARSAVASANQAMEAARARLDLLREGASATQIAVAREQVRQARLRAETLRTKAGYCVITSPVNGVITRLYLSQGDLAQTRQPIMSISENSTMVVKAALPDKDLRGIAPGRPALVQVGTLGEEPLKLKVTRVYPSADPATRLVPLEIAFPARARVAEGAFARISLVMKKKENVVVIPVDAIVQKAGGKSVVFVVEKGVAHARPIAKGIESGAKVEVLSGVSPGESLVVKGQEMLKDGAEIKVKKPGGAGPQGEKSAGGNPGQQKGGAAQ